MMDSDIKTGLVLSGGGAKGAYQARILHRLRETFDWHAVVGVSVGALNGALLSTGSLPRLREIWREIDNEDVYTGGPGFWRYVQMLLGWKDSLYGNKPLEKLIRGNYDPAQTEIPLVTGSVDLNTEQYIQTKVMPGETISAKRMRVLQNMVLASTIIPGTWEPRSFNGYENLVDGGLRNITPIGDIMQFDVDRVVVIPTEKIWEHGSNSPTNVIEIAKTSIGIMLSENVRNDIDRALTTNKLVQQADDQGVTLRKSDGSPYKNLDIYILQPTKHLGSGMDFSDERYKRRIKEADRVASSFLKTYHSNN